MVSSFPLLLICAAGLLLRVRVVAGDANRDLFAAIETQARPNPLLWWFLECWTADFYLQRSCQVYGSFMVSVRPRPRPFHHLSHLHALFSVTTSPGKLTSREN